MNLVERCFGTCVNNFRTKSLDKYETKCLENCSERYIQSANRAGLRFQEHQAVQMKRAQDGAGGFAKQFIHVIFDLGFVLLFGWKRSICCDYCMDRKRGSSGREYMSGTSFSCERTCSKVSFDLHPVYEDL